MTITVPPPLPLPPPLDAPAAALVLALVPDPFAGPSSLAPRFLFEPAAVARLVDVIWTGASSSESESSITVVRAGRRELVAVVVMDEVEAAGVRDVTVGVDRLLDEADAEAVREEVEVEAGGGTGTGRATGGRVIGFLA